MISTVDTTTISWVRNQTYALVAQVPVLTCSRLQPPDCSALLDVWLAIPNKARTPRLDYPPMRIVRFSGASLVEGVEEHLVDGVPVCITSVTKTIADCFKYRNKIGLDVALESLHQAWRKKRVRMDDLWRFATVCRVSNVMRPYMESLA